MARRETNLKAPQFGIGGHLNADPSPGKTKASEHEGSKEDVRDMGGASVNGAAHGAAPFWYPRDLDLPSTSAPKMAAKPTPESIEKRHVEVIVRKKRTFSV
jgi:hypothetical protein